MSCCKRRPRPRDTATCPDARAIPTPVVVVYKTSESQTVHSSTVAPIATCRTVVRNDCQSFCKTTGVKLVPDAMVKVSSMSGRSSVYKSSEMGLPVGADVVGIKLGLFVNVVGADDVVGSMVGMEVGDLVVGVSVGPRVGEAVGSGKGKTIGSSVSSRCLLASTVRLEKSSMDSIKNDKYLIISIGEKEDLWILIRLFGTASMMCGATNETFFPTQEKVEDCKAHPTLGPKSSHKKHSSSGFGTMDIL
mmetsp:Transcript_7143/g.13653  ORF Transcript_7143/g.13653 Transcript_7143/m.13653 type:complete len:248 (+) Transcript_7143:986-1729(+)